MDELLYKEYSVSEKLAMYSEIRKAIAGETMNLSDAQWQELREYLDWTENNFVSRLTAEHPQLSDKALKLCMLVRLRLTDSMLAHIFHVSETSIKQRLQRMKKALGIEGEEVSTRTYIVKY